MVIIGVLFLSSCQNGKVIPSHYNPFEPVSYDEPTTFVTQYKISKLKDNPQACFDVLSKGDIKFEIIPDKETGDNCGFFDAARLLQSEISYGGNIIMTCPSLVALSLWEKKHIQVLAQEMFGQRVTKVIHYGTYACRNVNGASSGKRSQHSFANAIDIAGFELANNDSISVLRDWGKPNAKGEFLLKLRDSACDYFKTVLGPEYNKLHADHFHFDMGRSSICR